jgi:hypothetical protein
MRRASIVRDNASRGVPWSVDHNPFHSVVMSHTKNLKRGGLLIIQSYCGGIDTGYNPDYLAACKRQLDSHGLHLIEVHRFEHAWRHALHRIEKNADELRQSKSCRGFTAAARVSRPSESLPASQQALSIDCSDSDSGIGRDVPRCTSRRSMAIYSGW